MAVLFSGGPIRTMDPARPGAEALVVEAGRIAAVGPAAQLEAQWPGAHHHDLAGATLVPGFIDAHNHLSVAALHPRWRDVGTAASPDDLLAAVVAQAAAEPDASWIRVCNWNEATHGVQVTRADLDALGLDRPVVVAHYSLHQAVVCSQALDRLGIHAGTADPDGGRIERDERGRPTGLLLEQAWSRAHAASLAAYAEPDRWADLIVARARLLHSEGITAVHDAACAPEAEAVYRALHAQRRLPVGVVVMPHSSALLTNDAGARLDGPPSGDGDEGLRVGATKLFADGGIAIAIDVTMHGHPIRYGMTMSDLTERALAAAQRGFDVAVHAIGNVGVDAAIAAFRAVRAQPAGARTALRVEHVGIASRAQCGELAALGVIAVVQPNFVEHVGTSSAGARFDHHHWLPFRSLADAGVALAASSDDPCAPWSPLWGAIRGAARTTLAGAAFEPEEALGLDRWLHAMTAGAAAAGGQSHERGMLRAGLRADLVELRGRLVPPVHPDDPDAPRVGATWVGGERVYAAAG